MTSQRSGAWWLFWGAIVGLIYTYIGFPLLLALRGILRPQPVQRDEDNLPTVSLIIAAYNEAAVILDKLENSTALQYPRDKLEIIVASDGSDDATSRLVASCENPQVRLLTLPRQGKNRTLNAAVGAASGDVLVFSDADTMFAPDALRHLVAPFADPDVGAVGGDYRYAGSGSAGERAYWQFDRTLKRLQSRSGSMTSASGAIYAIRRSLYREVPDGVTDDFFISIQAPVHHRRLVFEPQAVAHGPIAGSTQAEFRRKVRVITAGLRGVWSVRELLNPREYGFFAVQLLSHKVLRRLAVVPLLVLAVVTPLLWSRGILYRIAALGQLGFHVAAMGGFYLQKADRRSPKFLTLPLYFDLVYLAAGVATLNLVRGQQHDSWVPERNSAATHVDATALSQ